MMPRNSAPCPLEYAMKQIKTTIPLLKQVVSMLEVDQFRCLTQPDGILVGQINGKHANWNIKIQVLDQPGQASIRITSLFPAKIPDNRQAEVLEFINRQNSNFAVGYFFMPHGEGNVCFYSSVELMDGHLTQEMLRKILYCNLNTVDSHFTTIMSLVYGQMTADQAYQAITEKFFPTQPQEKSDRTLQ